MIGKDFRCQELWNAIYTVYAWNNYRCLWIYPAGRNRGSCRRNNIFGDSDTTYDFMKLGKLYRPLAEGRADVMIGDRFAGGMEKGAMPWSHRIGVRLLSAMGRRRYRTDVRDFHCGMRGLTRKAAEQLAFRTGGMEFATEMIALAAKAGLRIGQCPVRLRKCTLDRKSKLRTLPDGNRHLRYMLRNPGKE